MLTSTTTRALPRRWFHSGRLKLGVVAGGVLLAVCAGAGIAAWRTGGGAAHSHAVTRSIAPAPAAAGGNLSQAATRGGVADALPLQAEPAGGNLSEPATRGGVADSAPFLPAATAPVDVAPQVILVGSVEQGDAIRGMLNASDPLATANGVSPLAPQIVVVEPEQHDRMLQAYEEENQTRSSLGLPAIVISDLTQPAAEPVPAPAGDYPGGPVTEGILAAHLDRDELLDSTELAAGQR